MGKNLSFFEKHDFLLRRLHSLTGIVPIGVFLIAHLVTNSSLLWGKYGLRGEGSHYEFGRDGVSLMEGGIAYFQKEVEWINTQIPHLLLIEITLWASIAFHSIFGIYIARTGRSNTARYGYAANWRYKLQRLSGYFGILFIFYHVATLRWSWTFLVPDGTQWSHEASTSSLARALTGGGLGMDVAIGLLYFLGVTLLVFHFANGLWTAAISWGLTISRTSQKRWGAVCAALGLGLLVMGWSAVFMAVVVDPNMAARVERQMESGKKVETAPSAGANPLQPSSGVRSSSNAQ